MIEPLTAGSESLTNDHQALFEEMGTAQENFRYLFHFSTHQQRKTDLYRINALTAYNSVCLTVKSYGYYVSFAC